MTIVRSGRRCIKQCNFIMINLYAKKAEEAFEHLYDYISDRGEWFDGTRAVFNCGIEIAHPEMNMIETDFRKWSPTYAENEWKWYLSGDPTIKKLGDIHGSIPMIWHKMQDSSGKVRSNYGWQWEREHQLDKVVAMLKENPETRKAAISIYDGKEISSYRNDTPCTYAVQFSIRDKRLYMSVYMRSNDIWFGFCNDQYCFSKLQIMVAQRLGIELGSYYHHAHNMHIYEGQLNRGPEKPERDFWRYSK